MAASHQSRDEIEGQIEDKQQEIDAIAELEIEIMESDSIGETRLSGLFHEARTTSADHWSSVSAFCQIEDGEVVVDHLDKLSDGRWAPEVRDRYDVIIGVSIRPFMDSQQFRHAVESEISQAKRGREQGIQHREDQIARMEVDR